VGEEGKTDVDLQSGAPLIQGVNWSSRLRILLAMKGHPEASCLRDVLEGLGHQVVIGSDFKSAVERLRLWQPDLLFAEESLGRGESEAGLRLAEICRQMAETQPGRLRFQALILLDTSDWYRLNRAKRTGAHVIVKSANFDSVVAYVRVVTDEIVTDRIAGPVLFGIHRYRGGVIRPNCENCEWLGSSVVYGHSEAQVELTPVRAAVLNALMFHRRSQSPSELSLAAETNDLLRCILDGHQLRASAIKMEISRLRQAIERALEVLGAPYGASIFLPAPAHGVQRYQLAGNWQLVHLPGEVDE
jgi:CheY-like chemotaxis protein